MNNLGQKPNVNSIRVYTYAINKFMLTQRENFSKLYQLQPYLYLQKRLHNINLFEVNEMLLVNNLCYLVKNKKYNNKKINHDNNQEEVPKVLLDDGN